MKDDIIHINPDRIDYIRVYREKEKGYKMYPPEPPKYTFFGLIKIEDEKDGGWADNPYAHYRYTTKYLLNNNYLFKEEHVNGKQWYRKPQIYIRMGKNYISEYFDSLEEIQELISKIKDKSKSDFQVLIEKT